MKKKKQDLLDFPEKTELWQAIQNGEVVYEHPSRAMTNGYMVRNNIPGRPVSEMVPFDSVYKAGKEPGELELI